MTTFTSTGTIITVNAAAGGDTSAFNTHPNTYKGSQTFNALNTIKSGINVTTGGFAQLVDTPNSRTTLLRSALCTQAQGDAAGYKGTLGGTTRVYSTPSSVYTIWGGGVFNGFGFFVGMCGSHHAWYGNDLYMIRIADPIGAFMINTPAPVGCVWVDETATFSVGGTTYTKGQILQQAHWYTFPSANSDNCRTLGEWGPMAAHSYGGWGWDAASEQIIYTSDAQIRIRNPQAAGSQVQKDGIVWRFNVNASTPKAAWLPTVFHPYGMAEDYTNGYKAGYSMVDNADGTFSFRSIGDYASTCFYINPTTGVVASGLAPGGKGPAPDRSYFFAPTVRDPVTNRYFELGATSSSYPPTIGISEIIGGVRTTKVQFAQFNWLPWSQVDYDRTPGMVVRNGIAYVWCGTNRVLRINIDANTYAEYVGSESVTPDLDGGISNNGIFGRWAYHDATGVFVGLCSADQNAWVFLPPASWGAI